MGLLCMGDVHLPGNHFNDFTVRAQTVIVHWYYYVIIVLHVHIFLLNLKAFSLLFSLSTFVLRVGGESHFASRTSSIIFTICNKFVLYFYIMHC